MLPRYFYTTMYFQLTNKDQLLSSFLIKYSWGQERRIFRVSLLNGKTVPYGYEYTAQLPLFTPLFAADRLGSYNQAPST